VVRSYGPVLLVDDSEDEAIFMQRAFGRSAPAPSVHWVNNGNDATLYLCGHGQYADRSRFPLPCLVLLDLKLPVKNGFEVLRWLRSYTAFAPIPIVVMSDCSDPRIIRRAYELGANSFLAKPHNEELRQKVVDTIRQYWLHLNVSSAGESIPIRDSV
jgi:CheY-like chemotaxis protein